MRKPELQVVGLVTPPDRPVGRGRALAPCPCKAFAQEHGIADIITPEDVNAPDAMAQIKAWHPDVVAVVAFGQFLRKPLLDLPLFGCVNCHFSLLPKYRGASPVVAALAAGERMTGVTVMKMSIGMDDGPIMLQKYEPIYSDVTGGELMNTLAIAGGVALAKALVMLGNNELPPPVEQVHADATFARKLKKTDGLIDWTAPVLVTERRIRAYSPWPGCYTFLPERFRRRGGTGRVIVTKATIVSAMEPGWREAVPGTVLKCLTSRPKGEAGPLGPVVKCADTAIMLTELKPEGGAVMNGGEFLRGRQLEPGERLLDS